MLYRRLFMLHAQPLRLTTQVAKMQLRCAGSTAMESAEPDYPTLTDIEDPGMNGGYVNPPRMKRQFRDPHADWWDKQERRNFGEPIHEDNDILGMFSPHEYTHVKPKTAFFQIGLFISAVFSLAGVVKIYYPDKPSVSKMYEGGLQRELGGPDAIGVRS
ncbi:hypothetical protein HI914_01629 [Erysiphe necator]|nr:hypothetical protein HI914_01629 [Erysiphe necator]